MAEATLFEHMLVLYKRRSSILIIMVASVATAVAVSLFMSPVYQAKAVFFVPISTTSLTSLLGPESTSGKTDSLLPPTDQELLGPYFGLLKSRKIAERVNHDFPQKSVKKLLRSDMSFELTDEFLITVYSRDGDPELAANIANAYVYYLNEILKDPETTAVRSDMVVMKRAIDETMADLQDTRAKQIRLDSQFSEPLLDEEIKLLTVRQSDLSRQLEAVKSEHQQVAGHRQEARDQLLEAYGLPSGKPLELQSAQIDEITRTLLDREIDSARAKVTSRGGSVGSRPIVGEHGDLEGALRAEFAQLLSHQFGGNATSHEELDRALTDLYVKEVVLETSSNALSRVLDELTSRLDALSKVKVERQTLAEKIERLRLRYSSLVQDMQSANLEDSMPLHAVVPVDRAPVPGTPAFPILGVNLGVSLISGLLFGIVYAFAAEGLAKSNRIRRRAIVEEILKKS